MKKFGWSLGVVVVFLLMAEVLGAALSGEDAKTAVGGWLKISPAPLNAELSPMVDSVCSVTNDSGGVMYHVVSLTSEGYVVCSADRDVEPIVMFSASGHYDSSLQNPLRAFLVRGITARLPKEVAAVDPVKTETVEVDVKGAVVVSAASMKWDRLLAVGAPVESLSTDTAQSVAMASAVASVNDLRVDSFVQTLWNQKTASGAACYNYYTPPNDPGDPNNYPSGCTATAWAQLMRYFEYPTQSINPDAYCQIGVWRGYWYWKDYDPIGGDGAGGAYNWDLMPYDPSRASEAQRQAIGALCADIGGASWAKYLSVETSAIFYYEKLMTFFGYGNVASVYPMALDGSDAGVYTTEIRPNLDARLPVILNIYDDVDGHVVVCDGYGFNMDTSYYHLNLGWGGACDAWYNLPDMDTGTYNYTIVDEINCNIYTNGTGYIISGRVFDKGVPVVEAQVSAVVCGVTNYAATDARGIFAVTHIPMADYDDPQYENIVIMNAKKAGLAFASREVRPTLDPWRSGNVWGVELNAVTPVGISISLSGAGGTVSPGGMVTIGSGGTQTFTATPDAGYEVDVWRMDGTQQQVGGNSFTLSNVQADCAVSVSFKLRTLVITITQPSGGTISPAIVSVPYGGSQTFAATPNDGYEVDVWKVSNVQQQVGGNSFTLSNVQADATVSVSFKLQTMVVTISQPSSGSISQDSAVVQYGGSAVFTATVPAGYKVKHWLVDEVETADIGGTCTVTNITSATPISVVFERIKAMPWLNLLLE